MYFGLTVHSTNLSVCRSVFILGGKGIILDLVVLEGKVLKDWGDGCGTGLWVISTKKSKKNHWQKNFTGCEKGQFYAKDH